MRSVNRCCYAASAVTPPVPGAVPCVFHLSRIDQQSADRLGELSQLIGGGNSMIGTHKQWSDLAHFDLAVVDHRHPLYTPHRDA